MTPDVATDRSGSRPLLKAYVLMWAMVGIVALTYLVVLVARPELVTFAPGDTPIAPPESNEGQRAMAKSLAELQSLRGGLTQAQLDIAKLKAELDNQDGQGKQLAERLTAIEVRLAAANETSPSRVAEANPTRSAEREPEPSVAATGAEPQGEKAAKIPAATVTAPKRHNGSAKPAGALETASVAAPARTAMADTASFGNVVVSPAKPAIGLKISSGPSIDALRLSWSLLAERHGDALKDLAPRYQEGAANPDAPFELLAGPVANAADARRICKMLQKRGVPCDIGAYSGNAL
ncbi:MAG: hypothetical protein AB1749_14555 [Pseudomonadota bacterium]